VKNFFRALKHNIDGVIINWFLFKIIKLVGNTLYFATAFILSIVSVIIYRHLRVRMFALILTLQVFPNKSRDILYISNT
jgi:hypothetical protein